MNCLQISRAKINKERMSLPTFYSQMKRIKRSVPSIAFRQMNDQTRVSSTIGVSNLILDVTRQKLVEIGYTFTTNTHI